MRKFEPKKTIGSSRQSLSRSNERDKEAADDDKDLISSLPLDLKLQILAKLLPQCIAKFIAVSKLWSSFVRGRDLTDLFLSRSSTPSFLFTFRTPSIHGFHTEEPSSGNRKIHITIPNPISNLSPPVRGLICGQGFHNKVSKVICNPSTGQFVKLLRVETKGRRRRTNDISNFLGYNPVNNQYKVLCAIQIFNKQRVFVSEEYQVFTLGAKEETWRLIEWKHQYCHNTNGLCRDGVVYYGANCNSLDEEEGSLIVSFDVKSEVFGVMKLPADVKVHRHYGSELVNYNEGIALVDDSYTKSNIDMWVLKDIKKQEWSKVSFLLPDIVWTWE